MTMTMDFTTNAAAAGLNEELTPLETEETMDPMMVWESTGEERASVEIEEESSSSAANDDFIQGAMLTLSPSKEAAQTNDKNNVGTNDEEISGQPESDETIAVSSDTAISPNAQPVVSPQRPEILVSSHSLIDDDSDNVDEDNDTQKETNENNDQTAAGSPKGGLGAQILMNRFSTWREKANETMTRAVKTNTTLFAARKTDEHSDISESISGSSSAETNESSIESSGQVKNAAGPERAIETADEEYAETQRRAAVAVKVAASSVVDTVASGFRGRYSGATATLPEPAEEKRQAITQSQTSLIMQSRAKAHMQSILDSLEPQEYVMLLGNGMLGVNLKQSYLKNNGVYIDFLVEGGAAALSGVVCVGDNLIKVGDVDVFRRGLILNVPQTIAAAKRPVVLVLSTGQTVPLERMNYIDVAVGMMHKIREEKNGRRDIASLPIQQDSSGIAEILTGMEGNAPVSTSAVAHDNDENAINAPVPSPSFDCSNPMDVSTPPLVLREMVSPFVVRRCNDQFSLSMLCQAATADPNFRAVLQNAFVTCVYDGRRLPFLSSHFSYQDTFDHGDESGPEAELQMTTASTQLMLFLELTTFMESYSLTPESKRRDIAKRIAFKFFLPSKIGNSLEPPMFDFHHIVLDADLRALEHALNDNSCPIGRDAFVPFQKAVMESLSGPPFLSFLISNECARMRAYLRNTAPFRTVTPGDIFAGMEKGNANMENNFLFLLMHLICQLEKEIGDEHDALSGDSLNRVMGAVGGVACAVYIKKRLLNVMTEANQACQSGSNGDDGPYYALVEAMEVVWEAFIAPRGGMLDSISNSNETDLALKKVRDMLSAVVTTCDNSSAGQNEEVVEALCGDELIEAFSALSEQLLHDYAVNTYSNFKEHRFHEWLCNEIVLTDVDGETEDTGRCFKTGCVRRLMRKAKLPSGVSPHKPIRPSAALEDGTNIAAVKCCNAEFALVFGTADGSGEVDLVPNPAMNRTDIRRYTCQAVVNEEDSPSASKFRIPQTLESYVTVPLLRRIPFSDLADDSRISADGWEISLVNFMVPNAASESDNHDENALFGVSLVFQKRAASSVDDYDQKIELVRAERPSQQTPQKCDKESNERTVPSFSSPIRFRSSSTTAPHEERDTRVIQVNAETPEFNRRLQERSWSKRMEDRNHVMTGPVTVGIALACRRNVVLAMRKTLTKFLSDQSQSSQENGEQKLICGPLVDLLGNFSHPDVEAKVLKSILEPYLNFGSSSWVDRPLQEQKRQFEIVAGQQLLDCLPPIPLALLFVTLLLEQKVVFSSSRRSVLFSAVTSVTQLFKPLQWSHLLVPLVPSALARDLLQYPAPFILGIPSEDPGNMEALNSLPTDVTLVDLDVGRVILASHFAHDDELVRDGEDPRITAAALRSQVLYLAQSLGLLFGARLRKQTWNVDSPSTSFTLEGISEPEVGMSDIEKLQAVCRSFLVELLSGTESCCFWIEEQQQDAEAPQTQAAECTVLFDEDRFFHIKNLRAQGRYKPLFEGRSPFHRLHDEYDVDGPISNETTLALSLDDFDLILETFLRCQSMSTFVSSRPKARMAYV